MRPDDVVRAARRLLTELLDPQVVRTRFAPEAFVATVGHEVDEVLARH